MKFLKKWFHRTPVDFDRSDGRVRCTCKVNNTDAPSHFLNCALWAFNQK